MEKIIENKIELLMITGNLKPYVDKIEFILEYHTYPSGKKDWKYDIDFSDLPAIKGDFLFGYRMNEFCQLKLYVLVILKNKREPEDNIILEVFVENINKYSFKPLLDWLNNKKIYEKKIVEMGDMKINEILDLIGCRCYRLREDCSVLDLYWTKFQGSLAIHRIKWLTRFSFDISLRDDRWKDPWINLTVDQDEISAEKLKPIIDWIAKRREF